MQKISLPPDANLSAAILPHGQFWAIEPTSAMQLLEMMRSQSVGQHRADYEAQRQAEADAAVKAGASGSLGAKPYAMDGGIALFSLAGPMMKAPSSLSAGTSTVRLRRQMRAAMQDDEVTAAALIIDSPGGSVSGTSDLAADIAAFAAQKPITAFVEDMCCSAAYWCASQCTEIVANNPTCILGSIGTIMVAYDMSRMYQNAGVEPLVFATGPYKGAGSQGTAITPQQRQYFQGVVDDLNAHFLAAVQSGRKLSAEQTAAVSDARIHVGGNALKLGLCDRIASLDDVIAGLAAPPETDDDNDNDNDDW